MRGETRRKARRCIHRRSIAARIAAKTTGAAAHGARERPRPRAPRQTRPEVPCAATVGVVAERNLSGRGGFDRTAARRRICIRRASAWTEKPPAQKGEHGYPDRGRTMSGKPAQHAPNADFSAAKVPRDYGADEIAADFPRTTLRWKTKAARQIRRAAAGGAKKARLAKGQVAQLATW